MSDSGPCDKAGTLKVLNKYFEAADADEYRQCKICAGSAFSTKSGKIVSD